MHHRATYMYINFQQNKMNRSVNTVHTNLFTKNRKLHKFATYSSNFETKLLSDMHNPNVDIYAEFENNWHGSYSETHSKVIYANDGRIDIACAKIISFFRNENKPTKTI